MRSNVYLTEPSFAIDKLEPLGRYHFAQAGAMLARGKLSDAIQQYVKALDIHPDWPKALCSLGIALARLGGDLSRNTALTASVARLRSLRTSRSRLTSAAWHSRS